MVHRIAVCSQARENICLNFGDNYLTSTRSRIINASQLGLQVHCSNSPINTIQVTVYLTPQSSEISNYKSTTKKKKKTRSSAQYFKEISTSISAVPQIIGPQHTELMLNLITGPLAHGSNIS